MVEVDSQLREPDRNELFARAARALGEAEDIMSRRHGQALPLAAISKLIESQQAMLMLIVKLERTTDNLVRSRIHD